MAFVQDAVREIGLARIIIKTREAYELSQSVFDKCFCGLRIFNKQGMFANFLSRTYSINLNGRQLCRNGLGAMGP
jgi:hypothetical protein